MRVGDILKREVILGRDASLRRTRRKDTEHRAANRLKSHETQYIAVALTSAASKRPARLRS